MALSWFFQAASTMIIGKSAHNDEVGPAMVAKEKIEVKVLKSVGYEGFRMPLHYPSYKREDYERMDEWKLDMLLREYGLEVEGPLEEKKSFAMGTFLWLDQL